VLEGESKASNFLLKKLATGQTTQVNLTYKLLVKNVIDTVVINTMQNITTQLFDIPFNVVLKKPVTHSDLTAGYPGSMAVDGERTDASRWVSAGTTDPHWIEIDLQGRYTISAFAMWRHFYNLTERTPQFRLQVNIADEWLNVISEDNSEVAAYYYKEFESITTDKVRFYVPSYPTNRVRLYEIEIMGTIADED
jgi:hypothetical protein